MPAFYSTSLISSLVDFCLLLIVALPVVIVKFFASPYTRGFFCEDNSIKLPYKSSTFSIATVALICVLVPIIVIVTVEAARCFSIQPYSDYNEDESHSTCLSRWKTNLLLKSVVQSIAVFLFGGIVTLFVTDIGKYSLGVLRPHFLSVCQPDWTRVNCSEGYVTQNICTGDEELIRDARLSFPSRHASISAFSMGFMVLFIEMKVHIAWSKFLKLTIQLAAVSFAMFCGYSRIFDNMHHCSDVLAGFALGIVIAFVCASRIKSEKQKRTTINQTNENRTEDGSVCTPNEKRASQKDECEIDIGSQISFDVISSHLNTAL